MALELCHKHLGLKYSLAPPPPFPKTTFTIPSTFPVQLHSVGTNQMSFRARGWFLLLDIRKWPALVVTPVRPMLKQQTPAQVERQVLTEMAADLCREEVPGEPPRDPYEWVCLDMVLSTYVSEACGSIINRPCPLFPDCNVCGHAEHGGEVLKPVGSDEAAARHAASTWSADLARLRRDICSRRRGKQLDRQRAARKQAAKAKPCFSTHPRGISKLLKMRIPAA